jgi:hypothetical protein
VVREIKVEQQTTYGFGWEGRGGVAMNRIKGFKKG